MKITKTKYKDGKMYIEYKKKNSKGDYDEFTLSCIDAPRSEYEKLIEKLCPFVIELCELPQDYLSRITVKSVSFSFGGDSEIMGVVITAAMKLKNSNTPLNLNTPHKPSEHYSSAGGDDSLLLPEKCVEILEALQEECAQYIDGVRAQPDLFKNKEA